MNAATAKKEAAAAKAEAKAAAAAKKAEEKAAAAAAKAEEKAAAPAKKAKAAAKPKKEVAAPSTSNVVADTTAPVEIADGELEIIGHTMYWLRNGNVYEYDEESKAAGSFVGRKNEDGSIDEDADEEVDAESDSE
jgi:membrane protein involved in colicin uptake